MNSKRNQLKKREVRQSVALTEATYDLSRDERRIIYLVAIQCAENEVPGQISFNITDYEIKVSDYQKIFGIELNEASRDLRGAIKSIYDKSVRIHDPDESTTNEKSIEELRWIVGKKSLPRRGSWQITLNPLVVPHLTSLANSIKYPIQQIVGLKNNYQYRLYDLFMAELEENNEGKRTIDVEWLRGAFCLGKSYDLYANIKKRIIEPAIVEINENTPLAIKVTENKQGRKVVSWTFKYSFSG
jgi:plasmid replication initiation protein